VVSALIISWHYPRRSFLCGGTIDRTDATAHHILFFFPPYCFFRRTFPLPSRKLRHFFNYFPGFPQVYRTVVFYLSMKLRHLNFIEKYIIECKRKQGDILVIIIQVKTVFLWKENLIKKSINLLPPSFSFYVFLQ